MFKFKTLGLVVLLSAAISLCAFSRPALGPEEGLKKAERQAREMVEEAREEKLKAYKQLERLRKDLRYISEELDREVLDEEEGKTLSECSQGGLGRLEDLRDKGSIDPKLEPALERLEEIYRGLPKREYAEEYAMSLVTAVSDELRRIAEQAKSERELLGLLDRELALPEKVPTEAEAGDLGFFPEDVPLEQFKRLGVIRTFLMKHRLRRPRSHVKTTAGEITAGKHNVQIGVELEGKVTGVYKAVDRDYTFDFGALHIELTPEWRLLHPKIPMPKPGQRVRIRGWTYWDKFHDMELEYDPEDPVLGINRLSLWEVHPVQDIEILP